MKIEIGAVRRAPPPTLAEALSGPAVQMLILAGALLCAGAGLSLELLAVLLSATAMSLVLIVLRGERSRNAAMRTALDRLVREARVTAANQD
ncbi:MAG: hypothetical protein EOP61_00555 [Sphingomonadales bacterium]|nr:MAG: hypothetical protein EOP61_00555 [Sphingomonadales bacterium]